jgi:hypothetical protein
MNAKPLSPQELRREGFRALVDRLGPADALRFLQQFDQGKGDYTKDRHTWLKDPAVEEIFREIEAARKSA